MHTQYTPRPTRQPAKKNVMKPELRWFEISGPIGISTYA